MSWRRRAETCQCSERLSGGAYVEKARVRVENRYRGQAQSRLIIAMVVCRSPSLPSALEGEQAHPGCLRSIMEHV